MHQTEEERGGKNPENGLDQGLKLLCMLNLGLCLLHLNRTSVLYALSVLDLSGVWGLTPQCLVNSHLNVQNTDIKFQQNAIKI